MSHRCHIYIVKEKEMEFQSQAELLIHCGKSENNRNQVKRWIRDGKVRREGNLYIVEDERILVNGEVEKKEREEKKSDPKDVNDGKEVEIDNKELEELRKKNEKIISAYKELAEKYNKLLGEYKEERKRARWDVCSHLVFFYNKFQEWKSFVDRKAYGQANYNRSENGTQDTKETVKPEVYERYEFVYGEKEREECKIAEEIKAQWEKDIAELPF